VEALQGAALFARVSFSQPWTGPIGVPGPDVVMVEEETADPEEKGRQESLGRGCSDWGHLADATDHPRVQGRHAGPIGPVEFGHVLLCGGCSIGLFLSGSWWTGKQSAKQVPQPTGTKNFFLRQPADNMTATRGSDHDRRRQTTLRLTNSVPRAAHPNFQRRFTLGRVVTASGPGRPSGARRPPGGGRRDPG
jgi:hypothetical protein